MSRGEIFDKVREAELRITGKRYCSNCRTHASVEGGSIVFSNNRRRWKCKRCTEAVRGR
jgi:hypothetical protein